MKRLLSIMLVLALAFFVLSGCDRRSTAPEEDGAEGSFAPETTVVGGLTQAVEDQNISETAPPAEEEPAYVEPIAIEPEADAPADADPDEQQDAVEDQPINSADEAADEDAEGEANADPTSTPDSDMPFATPTPQPNASVSQYAEISAPGLGFRFSYPANWVNIPGRSTVCYVQPL